VGNETTGGVRERGDVLLELGSELGNGEDSDKRTSSNEISSTSLDAKQAGMIQGELRDIPKSASSDSDESVRAEFGREGPGVVEAFVDEGRELEEILVGVVDPGLTREGEDRGLPVDRGSNETSRFRAQESARIEAERAQIEVKGMKIRKKRRTVDGCR
jgi:hypothetical protein